ncbi:MAG: AlpA family phage regulatory protein [Methylovulum sp.]|nr:AlpA family phage regulatory protein [Methylovulum sp.]
MQKQSTQPRTAKQSALSAGKALKPTAASQTTLAPTKATKEDKPYILPATGYVRLKQLTQIIPVSPSSVWRKSKEGTFPAPVKLSDMITAWKVEEIRAWLDSKAAA